MEKAQAHFERCVQRPFCEKAVEELTLGLDAVYEHLETLPPECSRVIPQNITQTYIRKLVGNCESAFSRGQPPDGVANIIHRHFAVLRDHQLKFSVDFGAAYWELFNLSFAGAEHQAMDPETLSKIRAFLSRIAAELLCVHT